MAFVVTVGFDVMPQAHQMRDHVCTVFFRDIIIKWHMTICTNDNANADFTLAHDTESPHGSVILNEVIATVSPAAMVVVFKIRSADDVPTLPWNIVVPPLVFMRKCPAVIEAAALVSEVMALAVAVARPLPVALVEAGKAVADRGSVAPSVPLSAVSVVAGWAPERMYRLPLAPMSAVVASSAAFAARIDMTGKAAIVYSLI
jgi:hypothetical protein